MRLGLCAALVAVAVVVAACSQTSTEPPSSTVPITQGSVDAHVEALRARLRKVGLDPMRLRRHQAFIIAGNGSDAEVDRGVDTVEWATQMLEQDFFTARPAKILDVFLFTDARTYARGVEALTGEQPSTPYGFYSKTHRGMFMNIATGGGTLVHEIVHPYVEADFPSAPPWLNEGLGSLFEHSAEEDGHIIGMLNWRLDGLQEAIAEGKVPSVQSLTHLGANEFYGPGSGTHYAQARYLLYYLQEKGLLRDFYKAFRAARIVDPSGYATLVETLGEPDMEAFQQRWQRWVAALPRP